MRWSRLMRALVLRAKVFATMPSSLRRLIDMKYFVSSLPPLTFSDTSEFIGRLP